MLFRLTSLIGYGLKTPELELGPADDFYFDDLTWDIPYAKTKELPWFRFERMLVSMKGAASLESGQKSIRVSAGGSDTAPGEEDRGRYGKAVPKRQNQESGGEELLGCRELLKYRLQASDQTIGLVEDMIADKNWELRYWLVDVDWPSGKRVLVPAAKTLQVNREEKFIAVDLSGEAVKNSPKLDIADTVDDEEERRVNDYYHLIERAA